MFLYVFKQPDCKSFSCIFYKKTKIAFLSSLKKIQKKGIITSLYLSTRIWLQKFQKKTQN
jgi:hypothetical protein